jgi:hypothetical protein
LAANPKEAAAKIAAQQLTLAGDRNRKFRARCE